MDKLINPFEKFNNDWALVTAGSKDHFNAMTIAWGSLGTIWKKSVITIYVRPERFTHSFLKENEYFTVSFYDDKHKDKLLFMGRNSGRDMDKVKKCGLTPFEIEDNIISFKEATETYICKKIYTQDLNKENIPEDCLYFYGESGKAHTMFIGEVIKVIR